MQVSANFVLWVPMQPYLVEFLAPRALLDGTPMLPTLPMSHRAYSVRLANIVQLEYAITAQEVHIL